MEQSLDSIIGGAITITQFCGITGLPIKRVKYWCENGLVDAAKENGRWLISEDSAKKLHQIILEAGGIENLHTVFASAAVLGIKRDTLYNYIQGGLPLQDIIDVEEPLQVVNGVVKIPSINFFTGDGKTSTRHYITSETISVLEGLKSPDYWIPSEKYAGLIKEHHGFVKRKCRDGRLKAKKFLGNFKVWYVDPLQLIDEDLSAGRKIVLLERIFEQQGLNKDFYQIVQGINNEESNNPFDLTYYFLVQFRFLKNWTDHNQFVSHLFMAGNRYTRPRFDVNPLLRLYMQHIQEKKYHPQLLKKSILGLEKAIEHYNPNLDDRTMAQYEALKA